jgi:predicted GNAT family N-acyltransferase
MIKTFFTSDKELFDMARFIRQKVFIEEQEVDESEEFDEYEDLSKHYLILDGNKAVGTARWRHIGDKIKLERFAVLKEYRSQGFGNQILRAILDEVLTLKKPIYLHAQLRAVPFYERQGFKKVGEMFSECDIDHYKMVIEA